MASIERPADPAANPEDRPDDGLGGGLEGGPAGPRYLVARAAGQRVAIPLEQAREIVHARQVTRLPGALPWVAGLFNLRGTVLTVLDVAVRLGGRASVGPVLVVEVDGRRAGLRVDGVDAVLSAEGGEQPIPAARSAEGGVRGSVAVHDGEALVLDVAALQNSALAEA